MAPAPALALTDLTDAQLEQLVVDLGGKPFQARQVGHWVFRHGAVDHDGLKNLPVALRQALAQRMPVRSSKLEKADLAEDGTEKLLLRLHDGETIECVIIPEGERITLCISSQAGCPVACVFCASGMLGVRRNLSAGEIVEQVLHARDRLPAGTALTNLVVMGMGEPMLNLRNLLQALARIQDEHGIGMGARRITVSTSGYPKQMAEFTAADPRVNLAVSLHAADEALRKQLVPTATSSIPEILGAAQRYFEQSGREITFEVVLLEGVNDRPVDAEAMIDRLGSVPCTVNLIPWNEVDEIRAARGLRRPAVHRIDGFAEALRAGGLKVTVRRQRGADRSAACGQLRLRALREKQAAAPAQQG